MQNLSFFRSIILLIVAAVIAHYFVLSQVSQIRQNQDQQVVLQNELARISTVNQILSQHQSSIASIPVSDRQKLLRFIPTEIDELILLKELENILVAYNISPTKLAIEDNKDLKLQQPGMANNDNIGFKLATLSFETTYDNFKQLLNFSENHPYVMEFREISMSRSESSGFVQIDASIAVYFYNNEDNLNN